MKAQLQRVAELAARKTWAQYVKIYGSKRLGAMPSVQMNARLKTTAGRAWLEENKIDLSVDLMRDFVHRFCTNTIPHEIAHIVAFKIYGYGLKKGESHGTLWQGCMHDIGLPATIYHDMIERRQLGKMLREEK